MEIATEGPEIRKSALIVVDMQNDFVHSEGRLGCKSREVPEAEIDMPLLQGTIPQVQRLVDAFREAGRPVVYVAHILKADYSDAQVPYWRFGIRPGEGNHTFIVENTWGAQIVDELKPKEGEHLIIKKGFGGFSNTPLDTVLRNLGVTTCVVSGVTTCVCVSTTVPRERRPQLPRNPSERCGGRSEPPDTRGRVGNDGPRFCRCEDH